MNERPRPISVLPLWDRFESRVLEITRLALILMQEAATLPDDEKELNQRLGHYIREASWQLKASDTGIVGAPHLDALNQPDLDDVEPARREDTRPDFQWELKDLQARNRSEYQRFYAMECKRLGSATSHSWVLNEQYIINGVRRFLKAEYSYGSPKSNPSAVMIGYVQNMELEEILIEVNGFGQRNAIPQINLSKSGWRRGISLLDHQLNRPEIDPSPLSLRHLWVDLRRIPIVALKKSKPRRKRAKGLRLKR